MARDYVQLLNLMTPIDSNCLMGSRKVVLNYLAQVTVALEIWKANPSEDNSKALSFWIDWVTSLDILNVIGSVCYNWDIGFFLNILSQDREDLSLFGSPCNLLLWNQLFHIEKGSEESIALSRNNMAVLHSFAANYRYFILQPSFFMSAKPFVPSAIGETIQPVSSVIVLEEKNEKKAPLKKKSKKVGNKTFFRRKFNGCRIGTASPFDNNCLIDSLLQHLKVSDESRRTECVRIKAELVRRVMLPVGNPQKLNPPQGEQSPFNKGSMLPLTWAPIILDIYFDQRQLGESSKNFSIIGHSAVGQKSLNLYEEIVGEKDAKELHFWNTGDHFEPIQTMPHDWRDRKIYKELRNQLEQEPESFEKAASSAVSPEPVDIIFRRRRADSEGDSFSGKRACTLFSVSAQSNIGQYNNDGPVVSHSVIH